MAAYLEHMALYVKDLDWHIEFFKEVLDMDIRMTNGQSSPNRQVWLYGGLQLIEDLNFNNFEGRSAHLGIMAENQKEVLEKAYAIGVKELPQGHNWFKLPSGLCIEVNKVKENAVQEYLNIDPWL